MKTAFAGAYGISIAFPADYEGMFWIDAKAMEPSLDWIGFMAYDIIGSSTVVAAHTDITVIASDILPLWFDDFPPAKINLGLASYGRGYTLTSSKNLLNPYPSMVACLLTILRHELYYSWMRCYRL